MRKRFLMSMLVVAMTGVFSSAAWAQAFKVDSVHSNASFRVKHLNTSYAYGRFNDIAGTFTLDGDNSTITIMVDTKSVDTKNEKRDNHLRGPDFFNVKQFPEMSFKSTKAKADGDKIEFTGDFSLHGVTKSITVVLAKTGEGPGMAPGSTVAGLEGSFTIKRSDYGMTNMVGPIGDEVTITVAFEGGK